MYKVNDIIVCKKEVCKIKQIKEKYYKDLDYYIMHPIDDESLIIQMPTNSKFIRNIINKETAINLINNIPNIEIININDKMLENEYRNLLNSGNLEDLVKIIKTTYFRNEQKEKDGKKKGEKDTTYFKKSERLLYNELSISLNMTVEEVKKYIYTTINE